MSTMALLAGDALLTEAFRIMADAQSARDLAPELILDGIRELAQAAGALGLVGGQAFDLEAEETDVVDLPMETLGGMGVQGLISDFPEKFSKLCCR